MAKLIGVLASLDTKSDEADFVAEVIRARGHQPVIINSGVMEGGIAAQVSAEEVARAGGNELADLRSANDKGAAMSAMAKGAAAIAARLASEGRIDALIGMGGTAGTATGSAAMRALPLGFPKVLVSTVASGDTRPYVGTKDITMIYSVVDVAGLNRISRPILANAAGAICGMAETSTPAAENDRPLVGASMFGNTTACVDRARAAIEAAGYEVLVFHATGAGGATMEDLVLGGHIDAVLDLTTTELADDLCGGVFSAGPRRLEAASAKGIPQVVAPGCLDMVNFSGFETVPEKYRDRRLYRWNDNVTLLRTSPEENALLGASMARKLNASKGPVTVMLPLGGVSQLDSEGGEFWWPEADKALFDAIRETLRSDIRLVEMDANINDPEFADAAVTEFRKIVAS